MRNTLAPQESLHPQRFQVIPMSTPRPYPMIYALGLALLLSGCSQEQPEEIPEMVRPVKSIQIVGSEQGGIRNFPASIDAVNKAELSFRIPGKVAELLIKEGDLVEKDQLLAALDPTDYKIVLEDREATFSRAKKDFDRGKDLVGKGFISRTDYDKLEAEFKNATAALNQAKQDMAYTALQAPFGGTITKRYIDQFEEVQAKEVVLSLRDTSELRVMIDVPENILKLISNEKSAQSSSQSAPVWATFDALPEKRFQLTLLEAANQADPQTQTFQVTFTMPNPDELTILPGMTANVIADLKQFLSDGEVHIVPVSAIVGDAKLDAALWIVDEESMTVKQRPVKIGKMTGYEIEVTDGLKTGERVVTAGAAYLAEDMKVRLMKPAEQAKPRPDDVPLMMKQ